MATSKRPLDLVDEDGFQPVGRKRRPRRDTPPPTAPLPQWRVVSHQLADAYQAVRFLEDELKIALRVTVSRTGDLLLRGADWGASTSLEEVAAGQPRGFVLKRLEPYRKGVLEGFHTSLPLDPVKEHPLVAAAERCTHNAGHGRRLPTRQVLVTLRGPVPPSLDLGCWGVFDCRPFVAEPVRCFRCQAFGHFQRQCKRKKELCGICSGDHASRDCIRRLREGGERPAPCCPNCGAGHHAWNRRCPARLRRIPGRHPRREEATRPPPPPTPAPAPPPPPPGVQPAAERRRRRRPRNRRRKKKTEPAPTLPLPAEEPEAMVVEASRPPETAAARRQQPPVECKPPTQVAPQREASTQTAARTFTFKEADLVRFLVGFDNLLAQEGWARSERCSHEPALSCARRYLDRPDTLPRLLPTARPLVNPPDYYDHVGEPAWVDFGDDDDYDDEDALLD